MSDLILLELKIRCG